VSTPTTTTPPPSAGSTLQTGAAVAADAVQREVSAIKDLIAEQTKIIASQAEQMQNLTAEIESLKAKLG
jgi:coronin-1B/1C/6